uniref:Zona pellucida-like domain-containing protein 1 n=1 Tax=Xiphophorus couchianus TaxID=32473 RepID=A0A3B5LXI0_9TELE
VTDDQIVCLLLGLAYLYNAEHAFVVALICIPPPFSFSLSENADINVTCGTQYMDLSIYICPIYNAQYNESLMALNNQFRNPLCFGKADWSVTPPVLRFRFPINETSLSDCDNNFQVFNSLHLPRLFESTTFLFVNISGMVMSVDPSAGMITYRPQIHYIFSCKYPMQYLLNNTQLSVSSAAVSVKDSNGTFVSTLSMILYNDSTYSQPLSIPMTGLALKTRVFAAVKATNLDKRWNILMDYCYTTPSGNPNDELRYDLFFGCSKDPQTTVFENGKSQMGRFSFEVFRFVKHRHQKMSTVFLHCVTKLCRADDCIMLIPVRQSLDSRPVASGSAVITAGPIITRSDETPVNNSQLAIGNSSRPLNALTIALISGVAILGGVCVGFLVLSLRLLQKSRLPTAAASGVWNPSFN